MNFLCFENETFLYKALSQILITLKIRGNVLHKFDFDNINYGIDNITATILLTLRQ